MKIRIALTSIAAFALVAGLATTATADDNYNQGDDAPGCTPYISGPVMPGDCGAGQPDPTQPNEGRPNGAGDWKPDCNGTTITNDCGGEQLPEEVIGRQYDNGCYQQTVDHVYCPVAAPTAASPAIVAPVAVPAPVGAAKPRIVPQGGIDAGSGSTATTFSGSDTYL